jgi:hypothetical protein
VSAPLARRRPAGQRDRMARWHGWALAFATMAGLCATWPNPARAFGDEGVFHPRVVLTGTAAWEGPRRSGPAQWAWELKRRTSAPARTVPTSVRADTGALLAEPFAVWAGEGPIAPLTPREIDGFRRFFAVGGTLVVDDAAPETGQFGRDARREIGRVLPEAAVIPLPETHVIFHSFYLVPRPTGRVEGSKRMDGVVRGGNAQVIFLAHDLLGALALDSSGMPAFAVAPGGDTQREHARRLAVNLAMYVLCSNYKDDQVHAPFLMRRRGRGLP